MTNIMNLINTMDEIKGLLYELPTRDMMNSFKKMINKTIKSLLNDYCEESEHFEAVFVREGTNGEARGVYFVRGNFVMLRPELLDFINNYKDTSLDEDTEAFDIPMIEMAITTYLHECRHAKQHADNLDVLKGKYKSGLVCEETEEFIDLYYNHPKEIDARDYADMYCEDAAAFIEEHLYERLLPQFQSLLGM